jgi:hypothetical protein
MTKSKAAFLLSVRTLFNQVLPNGKSRARRVYFWTFTFREVVSDEIAFKSWNHLRTLMQRKWSDQMGVPGVRVVEVHPGGHGLHFHLLIARRVDVNEVRRLAIRAGFGRIHVRKAKQGDAEYMAKYLAKGDDGLKRGTRRWGNFGTFKGTRVKDIVIESELCDNIRQVRKVVKCWGRELFLEVYRLTVKYGHCLEWPIFPALADRPVKPKSDNDCPEYVKPHVIWQRIRHHCQELGEWVTSYVPIPDPNPF